MKNFAEKKVICLSVLALLLVPAVSAFSLFDAFNTAASVWDKFTGLATTAVYAPDIAVVSITASPSVPNAGEATTLYVKYTNTGNRAAYGLSYEISCGNSMAVYKGAYSNAIAAGATYTQQAKCTYLSEGVYTVSARFTTANDANTANDALQRTLTVASSNCLDSDSGKNFQVSGKCVDQAGVQRLDACYSGSRVKEYYCSQYTDRCTYTVAYCPSDSSCVEGRCVKNVNLGVIDLSVGSVQAATSAFAGDEVDVGVLVKNLGGTVSGYSLALDFGDGTRQAANYTNTLEAGSSFVHNYTHIYKSVGTYAVKAAVSKPGDSNTANDAASASVAVSERPASSNPSFITYVVPAITDQKILPYSTISQAYASSKIAVSATPGEFEPASFVIKAGEGISNLLVKATDLTSGTNRIPASSVDIRAVKVWWQNYPDEAHSEIWQPLVNPGAKTLTPELLLKNDSLVEVAGSENYLWLANGQRVWISNPAKSNTDQWCVSPGCPHSIWGLSIPNSRFPVQDSSELQPVSIAGGSNKQFWITLHTPEGTPAGTYSGKIYLSQGGSAIGSLDLVVQVLPFTLSEPKTFYDLNKDFVSSIYYKGVYDSASSGDLTPLRKSEQQIKAELKNLVEHSVTNPFVYQLQGYAYEMRTSYYLDGLPLILQWRKEAGMDTSPLLLLGPESNIGYETDTSALSNVQAVVKAVISAASQKGYSDVYFYGIDEQTSSSVLKAEKIIWKAIQAAGGKVFVSGQGSIYDEVGDTLDLVVWSDTPTKAEAAKWHSRGHKLFLYNQPQAGEEKPGLYRRSYGLQNYFANYDGSSPFDYYDAFGNPWNDFDHWMYRDGAWKRVYRDHAFVYPAAGGVIDTIQWEGYREGIDDIKYITTLRQKINAAKAAGKDASAAEAYVSSLASSDLKSKDLNQVRAEIIGHILSLSSSSPQPSPQPPAQLSVSCTPMILSSDSVQISCSVSGTPKIGAFIDFNRTLAGYWSFNENSGSLAHDESSYSSSTCTLRNHAGWAGGAFGAAIKLDGVDDYAYCGNSGNVDINGQLTLDAWIYPQSPSAPGQGHQIIITKGGLAQQYTLYRYDDGSLARLVFRIDGLGSVSISAPEPDQWYHVVGVYDSSGMMLYLNGELKASSQVSGAAVPSTAGLSIGASPAGDSFFKGMIDEARVWSKALSEGDVKASYDAANNPLIRSVALIAPGNYEYLAHAADSAGNSFTTPKQTVTLP